MTKIVFICVFACFLRGESFIDSPGPLEIIILRVKKKRIDLSRLPIGLPICQKLPPTPPSDPPLNSLKFYLAHFILSYAEKVMGISYPVFGF